MFSLSEVPTVSCKLLRNVILKRKDWTSPVTQVVGRVRFPGGGRREGLDQSGQLGSISATSSRGQRSPRGTESLRSLSGLGIYSPCARLFIYSSTFPSGVYSLL